MTVIDIMEPEEHFAVDQYDDLASTQKPTLTLRQSDVKYVHAFAVKELEIMAPHVPDVLRDIVTQLGSLNMSEEDVASSSKAEITLTLEPRFSPMEGPTPRTTPGYVSDNRPRRGRQSTTHANKTMCPVYHSRPDGEISR